jgi:hypothetical protein
MQKLEITIVVSDTESYKLLTAASDLLKWESHFDLSIDKLQKLTHLYYLAWTAATRLKKTDLDFETWTDSIENVVVADPKA